MVTGNRALREGLLGKPAQELQVVDGRHDALLDERAHRGHRRLGKQDDGLGDAALAQTLPFSHRGDREHVDADAAQGLDHTHRAMPIGVCLDDGAEARGLLGERLPRTGVLLDSLKVDLDPGPAILRQQALI